MEELHARSRREPGRVGPVVLLVPVLALVLAVLLIRSNRRMAESDEVPAPTAAAGREVKAWIGRSPGDGASLGARLTPLHGATERQAFDARVLAGRFGLGPGEPFLLELSLAAGAEPLALAGLAVVDAAGSALVPMPVPPAQPGDVADPLAVLLGAPRERLLPGRRNALVLWGRAPGPAARITFAARDELALEPRGVPSEELVGTLLVDRRGSVEDRR